MMTVRPSSMHFSALLILGGLLVVKSAIQPAIESDGQSITLHASDVQFQPMNVKISKVISDIASNANSVDALSDRLTQSEEKILTSLQQGTNLNVSLKTLLNDVVSNLEAKTQDHINDLDGQVSTVSSNVATNSQDISTNAGDIDALRSKLMAVNTSFNQKFTQLRTENARLFATVKQLSKPKLARSEFFYDFETVTVGGVVTNLEDRQWVHFINTGNTRKSGEVEIPPFQKIATSSAGCAGVYNTPREVATFQGKEGQTSNNHVLFIQCSTIVKTTLDIVLTKKLKFNITASCGGGQPTGDGGFQIGFYGDETLGPINIARAGENGITDTQDDGNYRDVNYQFDTSDISDSLVGQKVSLRLQQSKNGQAHFHYIHIRVTLAD